MTARLWVFAGPNGAGKSTFVAQRVPDRLPVVNPDEIARTLPIRSTSQARLVEAGRLAVAQRAAYLGARRSFAIETTLTGRSEIDLMRRAGAAGYRINLIFIGLSDAALSAARVAGRVQNGGHGVPLADVFRRYGRSMDHLALALDCAYRALVIDNSKDERRLLLHWEAGVPRRVSRDLPRWAMSAIPPTYRQRP